MSKKNISIAIIIGLVLLACGAVFLKDHPGTEPEEQMRPDAEGWIRASSSGFSYQYPESLDTVYIAEATWPPLVERVVNEYTCEADAATDGPASSRNEFAMNGRIYCASVSSEGAAGSTYVSYEYVTDLEDMVVRVSFTLRYPQCANYDQPEQQACTEEEESFRPDALADSIISTIEREN